MVEQDLELVVPCLVLDDQHSSQLSRSAGKLKRFPGMDCRFLRSQP